MKKIYLIITLLLTISLNANDIIIKKSDLSVNQTINKIKNIVEKKGLTVFTIIDHKKGASKVNMKLQDTKVIIFGSAKIGTLFMKDNILAGLDLPLRILVYKQNNKTHIAYHNPLNWADNLKLKSSYKVAKKVFNALDKITNKVRN